MQTSAIPPQQRQNGQGAKKAGKGGAKIEANGHAHPAAAALPLWQLDKTAAPPTAATELGDGGGEDDNGGAEQHFTPRSNASTSPGLLSEQQSLVPAPASAAGPRRDLTIDPHRIESFQIVRGRLFESAAADGGATTEGTPRPPSLFNVDEIATDSPDPTPQPADLPPDRAHVTAALPKLGRRNSVGFTPRSHTPTAVASGRRTFQKPTAYTKEESRLKFLHWFVKFFVTLLHFLVVVPARLFGGLVARFTEKVYRKRQLTRLRNIMDATEDHETWDATAKALDVLQGYHAWSTKIIPLTKRFCEADMLKNETVVIAKLAEAGHDPSIGSYLQTALHRDLYGCTQPPLYRYYRGTKVFVSEYVSAVCQLIEQFSLVPHAGNTDPHMMVSVTTDDLAHARGVTPPSLRQPGCFGASYQSDSPSVGALTAETMAPAGALPVPRPIERVHLRTVAQRETLSAETGEQLRKLVEIAEKSRPSNTAGRSRPSVAHDSIPASPLMSLQDRIEVLEHAARSFGRTALLLSGGAALGMYHAGTVRALWNEGLLPRILSGSSAGAIIASIFCTRTDEEINRLCHGRAGNILDGLTLNAFELNKDFFSAGSLMDVKALMICLRTNVGNETFREAYLRTGRVLNVSIAAFGREGEKSMVLNYITAPNVVIWSGVAASCAMPGLFSAVQLMKKNADGRMEKHLPGQLWFDGSVPCDLPKKRLAELFNVNYFIVSQTNPHVVPFLPKPPSHLVNKKKPAITKRIWSAFCSESKYWLVKAYRFGLLPRSGGWEIPYLMASQSYTGDVTIRPIGGVFKALPDFINLTTNPTQRHMEYVVSNAQRQTWPHLIQIQYATEVERCLHRCLCVLRARAAMRNGGISPPLGRD